MHPEFPPDTAPPFPADYHLIPASETTRRRQRAGRALAEANLVGLLILQKIDIFYFTGTLQNGILWLPATGEPILWVWRGRERARREAPELEVRSLPGIGSAFKRELAACCPPHSRIGFEFDTIPAGLARRLESILPSGCRGTDASSLIRLLRAVKSEFEIARIRRAAAIMDEIYAEIVPALLRPGKSEFEILTELEVAARRRGHLGIIRMRGWNSEVPFGHVLTGPESTRRGYLDAPTNGLGLHPAFPQGASRTPIRSGVPVSIDIMVNYKGYMADATRLFCLGDPPAAWHRYHENLLALNQTLVNELHPGQTGSALYTLALNLAAEHGFTNFFMGFARDRTSFVGHGIGLEVDEFPFISRNAAIKLENGMIVALEPKLIIPPGQEMISGVVPIENTYLITNSGAVCLTRFPENITILPTRD